MKIQPITCLTFLFSIFSIIKNSSQFDQNLFVSGSQGLSVGLNTSTLQATCSNSPYWGLNLCQTICSTCQSGSSACNSCPTNFALSNGTCTISDQHGYHKSYLTSNFFDITQIENFSFTQDYLSKKDVVTFCSPDIYRFEMLGLFKQGDIIYFQTTFQQTITAVQLKLYFFSRFPNVHLQIQVNYQLMYSNTFSQLVLLDNTYQQSTNESTQSYIEIPALTYSSASNIIKFVDTSYYEVSKSSSYIFSIHAIYLDDRTSKQDFWGFNHVSVSAKRCQDCITNRTKTLAKSVGMALGITFGVLLVLVLILYVSVLYERHVRFSNIQSQNNNQQLRKQAKQNFDRKTSYGADSKRYIQGNSEKLEEIQQEDENAQNQISKNKNK